MKNLIVECSRSHRVTKARKDNFNIFINCNLDTCRLLMNMNIHRTSHNMQALRIRMALSWSLRRWKNEIKILSEISG